MSGFSQTPQTNSSALGAGAGNNIHQAVFSPFYSYANLPKNNETKARENNIKKKTDEFKATLPDVATFLPTLLTLKFYALCPNGKRIPVEKICEEYAQDPNGLVYRTMEDRLVLVIQAVFPEKDAEKVYWQQAFYLSTGESSGMPGTWLPFNGILIQGIIHRSLVEDDEPQYSFNPRYGLLKRREAQKKSAEEKEKTLLTTGWFSKEDFGAPGQRDWPFFGGTLEGSKKNVLKEVYDRLFLPEGRYMYYNSSFDRFGTLSYVMASHAIGSRLFTYQVGEEFSPAYRTDEQTAKAFVDLFKTSSPLQPCFIEIAKNYPIVKPYEVNAYIDKHHAISYMNSFREYGIFPPGLAYANVPIKSLGYSIPHKEYWDMIDYAVKKTWEDFKLGKITLEDVKKLFANPQEYTRKVKIEDRERSIFPNEKKFTFNLNRKAYERKPGMMKYYEGGRRKSTRKPHKSGKRKTHRRRSH